MKLMDRYLLREYLTAIFFCLAAFAALFVICDLFGHLDDFMEARTPPALTLGYYLLLLGSSLQYLLPASLLFGTLYTLWRMSRHNEIIALRASGVSLPRVMLPVLVVATALSVSSLIVNETAGSLAGEWVRDFAENKCRKPETPVWNNRNYYNSSGRRLWSIGEMNPKDPYILRRVKVAQHAAGSGVKSEEIVAERAEWVEGRWRFHDGHVQKFHETGAPYPDRTPIGSTGMEMPALDERPWDLVNEKRLEFLSALEIIRYLSVHPGLSGEKTAEMKYKLHSRMAMPWACLVVTLFAIPAGVWGGRHSALAGVFAAMVFFFAFYAIMHLGLLIGMGRLAPAWFGAWLANAIFLAVGLGMMFRFG